MYKVGLAYVSYGGELRYYIYKREWFLFLPYWSSVSVTSMNYEDAVKALVKLNCCK